MSIEESSPAERVDLFARCFALTTREQELLGHLVKGNDTKQIARAMFLSEHTVQALPSLMLVRLVSHRRIADHRAGTTARTAFGTHPSANRAMADRSPAMAELSISDR